MVNMSIVYEGGLHCRLTHGPSGAVIMTDAPKDNMGKGEAFSPTDLVCAALAACMVTTMGIVANRHEINLDGTTIDVQKHMVTEPVRRIGKIAVQMRMAKGIPVEKRKMLENAAHSCPVQKSLHADTVVELMITYLD